MIGTTESVRRRSFGESIDHTASHQQCIHWICTMHFARKVAPEPAIELVALMKLQCRTPAAALHYVSLEFSIPDL
jgi:hypothetical protein